jgi:cytidyltransferase-like protein
MEINSMRVGIKSGAFTVLHAGHVWCIQECRKKVDWLVVLTNDDKYIMHKKGNVPIGLEDRKYILKHIKGVDEVDHFEGLNEHFWIKNFADNRLKQEFGSEAKLIVFHTIEIEDKTWVPGQSIADEIIFIPRIPPSVSQIYNEIKNGTGSRNKNSNLSD